MKVDEWGCVIELFILGSINSLLFGYALLIQCWEMRYSVFDVRIRRINFFNYEQMIIVLIVKTVGIDLRMQ